MARPSLTRSDYIKAAANKGLEFIDSKVPDSVTKPTRWRCKHCGTEHVKSYRAVEVGPIGCTCQNSITIKPDKYNQLADRLGIEWYAKSYSNRLPRNSKTPTIWVGRNGELVEATYAQLAYGTISKPLRRKLGIPLDEVITPEKQDESQPIAV